MPDPALGTNIMIAKPIEARSDRQETANQPQKENATREYERVWLEIACCYRPTTAPKVVPTKRCHEAANAAPR